MIAVSLLVFAAVLIATAGGYFLLAPASDSSRELKRRLDLLELRGIGSADIPDVLKEELLSDVPLLQRALSRLKLARRMDAKLRQAGMEMTVGVFTLLSFALLAIGALAGLFLHWPFVLALLLGALLALLPGTVVGVKGRRRMNAFTAQFPDALEMFARSLRAGHSFTGAIQLVAQEMPHPMGPEFRQVFDEQNLGVPLREALTGMTRRVESLDARFFVTAILIQRETGGNLAEIIDKIAHVIRERFRIQGQLKIFTAQARMTGIILSLLPVGLALAIGMLNPDYLKPLWFERAGRILIALALCMQIAGALVIRKIVRIKI
ncbi:MAG: type II secretion system F family protein [bacterium]|nr:type II secretion system F family protein [bacterium]